MKTWFMRVFLALHNDKRGVTIIEYALLASLIAIGLTGALISFKGTLSTQFTNIGTSL